MANLGIVSGHTIVTTVTSTAKVLGVKLPAPVADELAQADQLITRAENLNGTAALNNAVLDALANGRDHHNDPNVQALLLDHVLVGAGIGNAARDRADMQIKTVLVEHADTILTSWARHSSRTVRPWQQQ